MTRFVLVVMKRSAKCCISFTSSTSSRLLHIVRSVTSFAFRSLRMVEGEGLFCGCVCWGGELEKQSCASKPSVFAVESSADVPEWKIPPNCFFLLVVVTLAAC